MFESITNRCLGRFFGSLSARGADAGAEALEARRLLTVNITNPIADLLVNVNSSPSVISITNRYEAPNITGTVARFDTVLGVINVQLEDTATPATVANFLRYIDADLWDNTIFHRSVSNFVIQGGGFFRPELDFDPPREIPEFPSVVNEPGISNLRGTIAMAKQADLPNSATSQWFFNLGDNSSNLDNQNGGFTVFGHVILGLDVMDAIAAVPTFVFDSPFDELPLRNFNDGEGVEVGDYIGMNISRGDKITYSVISSNTDLVAASLSGTDLTLTYTPGREGAANVTVRATAADGTFADDTFTVTVGSRPSVGQVAASPDGDVRRGTAVGLTASGVSGPLIPVNRVQFFRDVDGNGALDASVDSLLGEDSTPADGYTLSVDTSAMPVGVQRFFARAIDQADTAGDAVSTSVTLFTGPRIARFNVAPETADRLSKVALTASGFDVAPALLRTVEFYHDTDGNNALDPAVDKLLKSVSRAPGDTASVMVSTKGFRVGANTLFVRAKDSLGDFGDVASTTLQIINIAPTVSGMSANKPALWGPGAAMDLRVNSPKDSDGRISRVEYYRDSGTSPDGSLDTATDTFLGRVYGPSGPLTLRGIDTSGFAVGSNRFFARVIDLEGGISRTVTTAVYFNAAPTIGAFTPSPASGVQSGSFTLEATGVRDADGAVKRVEFYWDANGDGVINSGDRSLGRPTQRSGIWSLVIRGKQLSIGQNRILARAFDTMGIAGPVVSTTITLTQG